MILERVAEAPTARKVTLRDVEPGGRINGISVGFATHFGNGKLHLAEEKRRQSIMHGLLPLDTPLVNRNKLNEDRVRVSHIQVENESYMLAVVADGVGGNSDGAKASEAATVIADQFTSYLESGFPSEVALAQAVIDADEAIKSLAKPGEELPPLTTLSLALVDQAGEGIFIRLGDSRGYIFSPQAQEPERLAPDQSVTEAYLSVFQATGKPFKDPELDENILMLTDDDRYTHPKRNLVVDALGGDNHTLSIKALLPTDNAPQSLYKYSRRFKLKPGQRLLLCSDGLWEEVRDKKKDDINPGMQEIMDSAASPQEAVDELIRQANHAGGDDNITAVILEAPTKAPTLPDYYQQLISAVIEAQPNFTPRRSLFDLRNVIFKDRAALFSRRTIHSDVRRVFETPVTQETTDLVFPTKHPFSNRRRWHVSPDLHVVFSTSDQQTELDKDKYRVRQLSIGDFLIRALAAQEYNGEILIPFIGKDMLGRRNLTLRMPKEDFKTRMHEVFSQLEAVGYGNEAYTLFKKFAAANPLLRMLFT